LGETARAHGGAAAGGATERGGLNPPGLSLCGRASDTPSQPEAPVGAPARRLGTLHAAAGAATGRAPRPAAQRQGGAPRGGRTGRGRLAAGLGGGARRPVGRQLRLPARHRSIHSSFLRSRLQQTAEAAHRARRRADGGGRRGSLLPWSCALRPACAHCASPCGHGQRAALARLAGRRRRSGLADSKCRVYKTGSLHQQALCAHASRVSMQLARALGARAPDYWSTRSAKASDCEHFCAFIFGTHRRSSLRQSLLARSHGTASAACTGQDMHRTH